MKISYDGNWDSLIEHLESQDCVFFVRKAVIEIVFDSGHIFVYKEPTLFRCKVIPFPKGRVGKSIYKKGCQVLDFHTNTHYS